MRFQRPSGGGWVVLPAGIKTGSVKNDECIEERNDARVGQHVQIANASFRHMSQTSETES